MIRGASLVTGLACVLAGCGASDRPVDMGPPDMMAPTAADLLAERPYDITTIPPGYTDAQQWPLVISLAGSGDEGTVTAAYLGYTDLSMSQGFFLVAPDADPLHARYQWDPSPDHYPNFDVEYLTAIIHDVESKYAIDPARVYFVGHSVGAEMAYRMGCDDADDVVAVVSLAGQVTKDPTECMPTNAVSVVEIHGTADDVLGYYGDVQNNPPDPTVPSAHDTVAVWARNDDCTGAIASTGTTYDLDADLAGNETSVEAYSGCPTGIGVELWTMNGGVHKPNLTPSFAPTTWGFLTAHPRP